MYPLINAIFQFLSITSIFWLPVLVLSILSTKLTQLIGRRLTLSLGVIGIPVHELSHLLMAVAMNHKITAVSFYSPSSDSSLGYVNHQYRKSWISPFTLLLIGLAPLLGGAISLYLVTLLLRPDLIQLIGDYEFIITDLNSGLIVFTFIFDAVTGGSFLETFVWGLVVFSIALFCSPSRTDFNACRPAVFVLVAVFIGFSLLFPTKIDTVNDAIKGLLLSCVWPLYTTLIIISVMFVCAISVKIITSRFSASSA